MPGGDLDGYENLVLLCRNDHRLIDDQPEVFGVSRLLELKANHEAWARRALDEAHPVGPADVEEELRRLLRESEARCVERWQSLGLALHLAMELANDRSVGLPPDLGGADRPVVVLVGDGGSGKSLAGERVHQADLNSWSVRPSGPAPVWMRARDAAEGLSPPLYEHLRSLGVDAGHAPVSLVVDGLDELGPTAAEALLGEIRTVVHARPGSRAIATTRMLDAVGNDDERVTVSPLSDEDAVELIQRVSGLEQVSLWGFAEPIREAARRPLFAIALGRLLVGQPSFSPATPAEVIDAMVRRAVGSSWAELRSSLIGLAIASLRRDGGAVRASEVVPAHQLEDLLATRLVVEEQGRVRFPLIVFAQWFAGEAVLGGEVDVRELIDSPEDLELWRYPLAVALSRTSQRQASELLAPLARREPAFASIVVNEAVRQYGSEEEVDTGTWDEAGLAVREATAAWTDGLGALRLEVGPVDTAGTLEPLGVRASRGRLTTAWYRGAEARPAVFELPSDFFPLAAGLDHGPSRAGLVPPGPAWAWRWSRDELADGVSRLLKDRVLNLAGTPLEHEAVWTVVLDALGLSSLTPHPVDANRLLEMDDAMDIVFTGTRFVSVSGLIPLLRRYVDTDGRLAPPWPGPDREMAGPFVWSDFSAERVRARAETIYSKALAAYEHFAAGLFSSLAGRMRVAATLPAVARGFVHFSDRPEARGGPILDWWLEPTSSRASYAEFTLGSTRSRWSHLAGLEEALKAARPQAARWIHASASGGILDIFSRAPATQLTYEWLWRDLQPLGWVSGSLSSWPSDVQPRLA